MTNSIPRQQLREHSVRNIARAQKGIDAFQEKFGDGCNYYALSTYGDMLVTSVGRKRFWETIVYSIDHGDTLKDLYADMVKSVIDCAADQSHSSSSLQNSLNFAYNSARADSVREIKYFLDEEEENNKEEK